MATNYSQYDKVKGREVFGVPICLALATGLLFGAIKYSNNYKNSFYKSQSQKTTFVQNQRYNLNHLNNLEKLTTKGEHRRK